MKAFVTGATGFVGHWVARALLDEGTAVRVLARSGSDRRNLHGLNVEVCEGDLSDAESLVRALEGCDELYHLAALYSTAEKDAQRLYATNVGGTKALLQAADRAGVARIVHTSTIGTIGRRTDGILPTEADMFNQWESGSAYARSKYLGELVALRMAGEGLSAVVVNPCAPIGPGDFKPGSSGRRIVDYLLGRVPSYVEGGINMISVRDVAVGHLLAARHGRPGERYILGHAQGNLSRSEFYALMERASGTRPPRSRGRNPLNWLRRRSGGRGRRPAALTCDPSRAVRELGLPQTALQEALTEAVEWFRANGYVR